MSCDLNRNEDQRQILDAAQAVLDGKYPLSRLRCGAVEDLASLAEFGAFLLALPEEEGGAGFGIVEEALVHVGLGRHLVSTRSLAHAMALRLAISCSDARLTEAIATAEAGVAAAVVAGDGLMLIDPGEANLALVFRPDRLELCPIAGAIEASGLGLDLTIRRMPEVPGAVIAASEDPQHLLLADLLISAQLLGVAEAARDLAVDYAGIRKQFGQLIGSFQTIKHHCANMAIGAERISALLDFAALALADGREGAAFQVAALRRLAPGTATKNAALAVQIHGGIGFSDEADAHRFVKQAHVLGCLGGGARILDLPAPLAPISSRT